MDLSQWVERHASFTPDRPVLRFEEAETSWGAFAERVLAEERAAARATKTSWGAFAERVLGLARGLRHGLGIGRGDRVAFLGYNHPDFLALLFACARLGAMLVPLNWRLAPAEHLYILEHAGVRALVLGPGFETVGTELAAGVRDLVLAHAGRPAAGGPHLDELATLAGDDRNPHVDLSSPLLVVYTSGTTGRPKGAVLRQEALFWNAVNSTHMHDLTSADRVLTVLPLFHVGGLNIQTTPALHAGAQVLLLDRFDAGRTLAAIRDWRPTLTVLVPATMKALIEHPEWERTDVSCLRMIACGSQVVPVPLLCAFNARGVPAAQVYGSTETCPIAAYQRAADALCKEGPTGKAALHCELRLVDRDRRAVPPGEPGRVLVRGPNVMYEYWADEAATSEALRDGWFHTGDIGRLDADGDLWIIDREKDVIISGGENIYPAELEAVLHAEPTIRDAVVVARPDARWGEVPVAVVVRADPSLDEEAVLGLFEGRLARYKHPRAVVFMDELPRNAMGKVLKYRVRDWLAARAARAGPS